MRQKWIFLYNTLKKYKRIFWIIKKKRFTANKRTTEYDTRVYIMVYTGKSIKARGIIVCAEKDELLDILKDIVTAIEENDYVLMNDAITYGIMEYLNGCLSEISEEE